MQQAITKPRPATRLAREYGTWAVVTGASEGIGRAIAVRLAEAGLNLVLVARREARLAQLAAELEDRFGIQSRVLPADLARSAEVGAVLEATEGLDVGLLVAAAGFGTSGAFVDNDLEAELSMVDVNVRAVTQMSHAFGQRFAARGRGGLVLMSSLLAFCGVPRAANYAATKAYVQALAEGLRLELGPLGVDVIASAPGPVRSGFADRADMHMGMAADPDTVARGTLAALGRWTTIRPGFLSRFLEASLSTAPRFVRTRILAQVMRGFTAHQDAEGARLPSTARDFPG